MDLTLRQLRMLSNVARHGTIAAAADAVGYTASAVSQQLSALEKAAGTPVLERVGRNVRLTDAGRELVVHADRLLAGMEEAISSIERVNNEVRGSMTMSMYESISGTLLPSLLTRMRDRHPDLEIRTAQYDANEGIEDLAKGVIDVSFVVDYPHTPEPRRDDLIHVPVIDDRFFLVVPEDDPIKGRRVDLARVAERPFIAPGHGCGRSITMACREAGFDPDVVHRQNDYPAALHLIAGGHGVALIPGLGIVHRPPGVRVIELARPVSRTVELAYRVASAERPAIKAIVEEVHNTVADMQLRPAA